MDQVNATESSQLVLSVGGDQDHNAWCCPNQYPVVGIDLCPASDERSSGSRHAALTIVSPSTMVPAPPLTRVMCPATPSPPRHRGRGVYRVICIHCQGDSALSFRHHNSFQIGSFNLLEYFFILNIQYHWGLFEVRPGQHTNWHK